MRLSLCSPRAVAAALAATACLAAAGCGSGGGDPLSGMSAKQVTTKAIADLKSASAFTIAGSGLEGPGQTVTLSLGFKGKDCTGTVGYAADGSIDLTVIGSTVWLKPDATFWKTQGGSEGAAVAKALAGKWIDAPTSNSNASALADICDSQSLTSQIPVPADVAKGSLTTVNGQKVLSLTDKAKDSTIYVTDTSAPQIVQVVSKQKSDNGQFTISYGVPASVSAPPSGQTVNGAQYGF
ncbi:MAG TPA: hypothetical protein VK817_05480 [Trebonia sp.]|jgi:hypothetical protein|nr:hypothetical protein [Trebonia sp.]